MALLPFTYKELVIGKIVGSIVESMEWNGVSTEELSITDLAKRFGGIDPSKFEAVVNFINKQKIYFTEYTREENLLLKVLGSIEYFPENVEHFLTTDKILPEYRAKIHEELFNFWKDYASHHHVRSAINSSIRWIGAKNIVKNQSEAIQYYYHRGMVIPEDLKGAVAMYDTFEEQYGFSPGLSLPTFDDIGDTDFCFGDSDPLAVYIPSLVGLIYFRGSVTKRDFFHADVKNKLGVIK